MTTFGFSRRVRTFIGICAQLAMLVFVFQIMAIDHWHAGPGDLIGVEGSAQHIAHCHGGGGGCASDALLSGPLAAASLATIAPPPAQRLDADLSTPIFSEAFLSTLDQPPRSA